MNDDIFKNELENISISNEITDGDIVIYIDEFHSEKQKLSLIDKVSRILENSDKVDIFSINGEEKGSVIYIIGCLDIKDARYVYEQINQSCWKFAIRTKYHGKDYSRKNFVNLLINPKGNDEFNKRLKDEFEKQKDFKMIDLTGIDVSGLESIDFSVLSDMNTNGHVFDISGWDTSKCNRLSFSDLEVEAIIGLDTLDLSNLKTTDYMFSNCEYISRIDMSNVDLSNVRNSSYMFYNCKYLKVLRLPDNLFNSKLKYTDLMFYGCENLSTVNTSGWDVSGIYTAQGMFSNCKKLYNTDFSTLCFKNLRNGCYMFSMSGIQQIDIRNWNLEKLRNAFLMFGYCYDLWKMNMEGLNLRSLDNIQMMFFFCRKLTTLNARGVDVSRTRKFTCLFGNCELLVHPEIEDWKPENAEDMSGMFSGCSVLDPKLDLSGWTVSEKTNIEHPESTPSTRHNDKDINKIISRIKRK